MVKKATKKAVKKKAVCPLDKYVLESPLPLPDKDQILVRNIHNTGIWTGTCKLAPGHAVPVDRGIVEKLLEAGFVEVME